LAALPGRLITRLMAFARTIRPQPTDFARVGSVMRAPGCRSAAGGTFQFYTVERWLSSTIEDPLTVDSHVVDTIPYCGRY
jgi:hypothetical protein